MQQVMLHSIFRVIVVAGALQASIAFGDEPAWVGKRPLLPEFYVGIGMAPKNRPAAEYTQAARNTALNDIASQITVSIASEVLRKVLETNERLEEEFQSSIRATATADLEGVRIIDTYEDDDAYWVYCRLSKADYAARRAEKLSAAASQSLELYAAGRSGERAGRVGEALGLYAQAFGPIDRYLTEPLVVQYEGRSLYLVNEVYNALRILLSRIEIRTTDGEREAKIGRPLRKPLEVTAGLRDAAPSPAADLPFRFTFTRGAGECTDRVRTDDRGVARSDVQKITAQDRLQTIEATLDLPALAGGDQMSPVVRTLLGSFVLPGATFVLHVSGVEVFVRSDESMFGAPLQQNRIEPAVKAELSRSSFEFVDDRSRASLEVIITADARRGSENYGLAFAFGSATISVLDLETGREIFKSSVSDVKEGSDSFEKAGYRCLDALARRISTDLVPQLVERVRK